MTCTCLHRPTASQSTRRPKGNILSIHIPMQYACMYTVLCTQKAGGLHTSFQLIGLFPWVNTTEKKTPSFWDYIFPIDGHRYCVCLHLSRRQLILKIFLLDVSCNSIQKLEFNSTTEKENICIMNVSNCDSKFYLIKMFRFFSNVTLKGNNVVSGNLSVGDFKN